MAKSKSSDSNYRDIISAIRKGNPEPVYLLMGKEAYYIDLIVSNLEKYVVDEDDRDFNMNIFYGADADLDYIVATAQQFPVFAQRKLVILKEAQGLQHAKTAIDKLAPYVSTPNQTTVFCITYKGDSLAATSKIVKGVREGGGVVFNSETPKDYMLPAMVKDYCSLHKMAIEPKAVDMLCEYIGAPLSKLFGEASKLISIKGGAGTITADDVERNIGISKEYNNLELGNALEMKDYAKAMKIVDYFENNPKLNPTPVTTGYLVNFFTNIVSAHYAADRSDSGLMAAIGMKSSYQLQHLKNAMRNYTPMQAVNAIHYLREFDCRSKGIDSMQNEYALLRELIFKVFT